VSNSVEPAGIGNRHDVVGRYFQDHPGVVVPIRVLDKARFGAWYNSFAKNGIRYGIKIVASSRLQREQQILNVGSEIFYPPTEQDPVDAAKLVLKSVRQSHLRREVPQAIKAMARRPDRVVRAAFRHYVLRQPASVGGTKPFLGIGTEQAPNPESRITLSGERDSFHVPRARLAWRLTENESRSVSALMRAIQGHWSKLGVAELQAEHVPIAGRELGKFGGFVDANHHMGATRMGTDPLRSVVDANCKVHDYDNLYIASSSIFPTGGFSNPTLSLLALCMRLCDRLKHILPGRPAAVCPAESC
jgi:choline dehydrogenase-like flavoprotein